MANDGGKSIERVTRMNTPVKTGALRASWKRSTATHAGEGWTVEVGTEVSYAKFAEDGTGLYGPKHAPYTILPRKPGGVLRFIAKDGTVVFARSVVHPGSPGAHMMAIALNVTEGLAEEGGIFRETLERWEREMDAQAARQR